MRMKVSIVRGTIFDLLLSLSYTANLIIIRSGLQKVNVFLKTALSHKQLLIVHHNLHDFSKIICPLANQLPLEIEK